MGSYGICNLIHGYVFHKIRLGMGGGEQAIRTQVTWEGFMEKERFKSGLKGWMGLQWEFQGEARRAGLSLGGERVQREATSSGVLTLKCMLESHSGRPQMPH